MNAIEAQVMNWIVPVLASFGGTTLLLNLFMSHLAPAVSYVTNLLIGSGSQEAFILAHRVFIETVFDKADAAAKAALDAKAVSAAPAALPSGYPPAGK